MQSILILGRQPALGLAELESLYGSTAVSSVGEHVALVDVDPCLLAFDRLGGCQKFCKLLTTLDTDDWRKVEKFLLQAGPTQVQNMPEGKMQLGISTIGFDITTEKLTASGLTLKKAIRKTGRSVRLIPNQTHELSAAQVIHNHLTGPTGWEIVCIRRNGSTHIAQTVKVQDIAGYTRRDRDRPKRDSKVGMLPPKLAQIIINLAVGRLPQDKLASICDIPANQPIPHTLLEQTILDPFCGTGVLLQEATLMGYDIYGSDIEPRMIDYTRANLTWLLEQEFHHGISAEQLTTGWRTEVGDATSHQWLPPVDFVACETYLGRPFTSPPDAQTLTQTVADCNLIIKKFLKNIHEQIPSGTRICIAVPAWQVRTNQFKFLPLIDQIADLGYNQVSFEHAESDQMIYYRSDQYVARQLLVLQSK
jgi:SAM-dependent methyltransferase